MTGRVDGNRRVMRRLTTVTIVLGLTVLGFLSLGIRAGVYQNGWLSAQGGSWSIIDFSRLSLETQGTLVVVLLLPIGALLTAVCRNIIGIQTFGTFSPSLLALCFVRAEMLIGIVVLICLMTVGVLTRFALGRLKVLTVPRLGIVLTALVTCLALSISILDYYALMPESDSVLLPMVILVMIIERFHIRSEEDGYVAAVRMLSGTLLVAVLCVAVFRIGILQNAVLAHPEILLFVAAILLLIGKYSGYRLAELWRFRDMPQFREESGSK